MNLLVQENHHAHFWARAQMFAFMALVAVLMMAFFIDPAWAGAAVKAKVADFTCQVLGVVVVIGRVIVTIAIFIFGYQVSFGGKRPTEAAPVLVGGLIIGIAGEIAIFFVPGGAACP
jgi:type IV secretion system protein VirB2